MFKDWDFKIHDSEMSKITNFNSLIKWLKLSKFFESQLILRWKNENHFGLSSTSRLWSLYLELIRFSLSIFSFSERLFNWHENERFFRFGSMPALPKLILFPFISLLQNGKISWEHVLQCQVSSLLLRYWQSKSLRLLHLI